VLLLSIGIVAFLGLAILGFAIWVFIPLFPAAVVFVIAVVTARRRMARKEKVAEQDRAISKAA
jgi:hypothetical protein